MIADTCNNMARMHAGIPFADWPRASLYDFTARFDYMPTREQWEAVESAEDRGWRFIVFGTGPLVDGGNVVMVRPENGRQVRIAIGADGKVAANVHA